MYFSELFRWNVETNLQLKSCGRLIRLALGHRSSTLRAPGIRGWLVTRQYSRARHVCAYHIVWHVENDLVLTRGITVQICECGCVVHSKRGTPSVTISESDNYFGQLVYNYIRMLFVKFEHPGPNSVHTIPRENVSERAHEYCCDVCAK